MPIDSIKVNSSLCLIIFCDTEEQLCISLSRLEHKNIKEIIVFSNNELIDETIYDEYKYKISFLRLEKFKETLQEIRKYGYIAFMNYKFIYFKNYLNDLLLAFKYSNSNCITKCNYFVNKQLPEYSTWHSYIEKANLGLSIIRGDKLSMYDIDIVGSIIKTKFNEKIYASDFFNVLRINDDDENFIYRNISRVSL